MGVTVRPYRSGGWEVDILWRSQDGRRRRERKRLTGSKSAAVGWGEARERDLLVSGITKPKEEVLTLNEFAPRFIEQYAEATTEAERDRRQEDDPETSFAAVHRTFEAAA